MRHSCFNLSQHLRRALWSLLGGALLGSVLATPVQAQSPTPSLSLTQNLAFGTVLRDAAGGSLVLGPFGTLSATGNVSPRLGGQFVFSVAVAGVPSHTFRVTGFPSSLTLSGPTQGGVSVDSWVPSISGSLDMTGAQIPANGGPQPIEIGATLRVSGGALAGSYTGMVTLQVYDTQNSSFSSSVVGLISVELGYAITASPVQDLSFGRIAVAGAASLRVNPNGTTEQSGALSVLSRSTPLPAIVAVHGTPNASVSVALPSSVTLWSGINHLHLDSLVVDASSPTRLDGSGALVFRMGATLRLAAGQATGPYEGVVVVTVSYD